MEQHRYEEALAQFKLALASPTADAETAAQCKKQASHILHFHLGRPEEADAL